MVRPCAACSRVPVVPIGPSVASVYQTPLHLAGAAMLLVSQSGRSPDLLAMATELHDLGQIYGCTKLDEPQRLEFFLTHSMDTLKPLPESKDTKALTAKLEKALKAFKVKK